MFDNNYEEEKSYECLCLEELTEFLKNILKNLKLFNGPNIDKYMFNNKITKDDRSLILNTIKEELKTYLAKGKLKHYRETYECKYDELINPDFFVWRYCTAYCYMNNFYNFSEVLFETYFSCCISKTEEEVEKEYQIRRKKEKEEILKRNNENEEKKFQKIYMEIQRYLSLTANIDEDIVRRKYELAKNYNRELLALSDEFSKASNKSKAIYCLRTMYNIYMDAIKNNCVGFNYHMWYRQIVHNRDLLNLFSLDIESLRLFILDYREKQQFDKIATDLEVHDIYCKALKKKY